MARIAAGQVVEKEAKRGRVFALRFRAYGERRYVTLGTAEDGWSRARAETELANVLADVRRGIWQPPTPTAAPVEPVRRDPTFHEFASEWWDAKRRELRPNTIAAYEVQLSVHLLPFFAGHRLSQITVEEVDRYRAAKLREAATRQADIDAGKGGAPLGAETINKTLVRLAQVLEVAVEYGHLDRNPAAGRRRRLKVARPQRSYLDTAEQIAALLDAAGALDASARADRDVGRRAFIATLAFAGLRIGELCDLRWRDVDLAAGWLTVGRAKTDAGVRRVEMLPALRDELAAHKARSRRATADAYVFATTTGARPSETNLRRRVLAPAAAGANARLAAAGVSGLPERLTPHSLRRTFASLLFALGRTAPDVMEQMGHTDPSLTLRIYARAMRRHDDDRERLRALAEGTDWAPVGTRTPRGAREVPDRFTASRSGNPAFAGDPR